MYRVLIVDDEQLMREALLIMISKVDGFEVIGCISSGANAVIYCKNNPVDIIFMDIVLPGETGIEASKKIIAFNPEISIYIISAYSNFEFAHEALKLKVNEYILKPVSSFQIKSILENYKKHFSKNISYVELLFSLVKNNSYRDMYYKVPEIIDEIYDLYKHDSIKLKNTFEKIYKSLFNLFKCLDTIKIQNSEEIFSISETMITDKKYMQFWLFKVMDYYFQKCSINKYIVLESVFKYIDEHIKENISLVNITRECLISQGYLSRIFKCQFKVSVMEYLHMKKLMIAKEYFSFTNLSVAEVAFRLGYNESNYFGKVFKKYEQITVFQYKNNAASMLSTANSKDDEYSQ